VKIAYLALHGLIGYGLCWVSIWNIWRKARIHRLNWLTLLYGLGFFGLAGVIVWHGFKLAGI
jgi:hypothetical protein